MKYLSLITLSFFLFACNEKKKSSVSTDLPFFHFDKVEYYHPTITKEELHSIIMKPNKTREEQALLQIVTGDIPVSIKDTMFIKNMEILNFKKDTIDTKMNLKISHLFSLREATESKPKTCNTEFSNILIFRRNNHIIGMAKIDFNCMKHQMIGERYNDSKFGLSGEYKELEKILKQYQ